MNKPGAGIREALYVNLIYIRPHTVIAGQKTDYLIREYQPVFTTVYRGTEASVAETSR